WAARAADTDAGRDAARLVVQEHVRRPVRVAADEVRRVRLEDHVAAVRADPAGRRAAPGIGARLRLRSAARHAGPGRQAGRAIADEHVEAGGGVAGDEVPGLGVEQDVTAVGAD